MAAGWPVESQTPAVRRVKRSGVGGWWGGKFSLGSLQAAAMSEFITELAVRKKARRGKVGPEEEDDDEECRRRARLSSLLSLCHEKLRAFLLQKMKSFCRYADCEAPAHHPRHPRHQPHPSPSTPLFLFSQGNNIYGPSKFVRANDRFYLISYFEQM